MKPDGCPTIRFSRACGAGRRAAVSKAPAHQQSLL